MWNDSWDLDWERWRVDPSLAVCRLNPASQSIQSAKILSHSTFVMSETRRFERPRSSRSQHSNPGGASCRSSTSVAPIIAAAMI